MMQQVANTTGIQIPNDKHNMNAQKSMGPVDNMQMRTASAKRNSHQPLSNINKPQSNVGGEQSPNKTIN
jgi:hypothetical protein